MHFEDRVGQKEGNVTTMECQHATQYEAYKTSVQVTQAEIRNTKHNYYHICLKTLTANLYCAMAASL